VTGPLIADAVQAGVTVLSGAVLAVGFLAALGAALVLSGAFLLYSFAARCIRARRARTTSEQQPSDPVSLSPTDLDVCELIWALSTPADDRLDLDAGAERLRSAIRDEQAKEADDA
jgi:hypothetical protein